MGLSKERGIEFQKKYEELEYQFANIELNEQLNKYEDRIEKVKKNNKRIIDYGFDYDGFNTVESLKGLIDMLVDYAKKNQEILEGSDN